ncbi:methyltransferase domain-containing protein [Lapidilactobacillus bayanensis]|nr:methyltransferase domain-containing protein [Lapidilactobacillus bayanensis]
MTIKKITQAANFLAAHQQIFRCPICHQTMQAQATSLVCPAEHQFDLSKKGTLYFLQKQIKTEYTTEMLAARGRMIQRGIFKPMLDLISTWLPQDNQLTIDVGCGEGGLLTQLVQRGLTGTKIGFDISKAGIYLASQQITDDTLWCVADLTNLPFADHSTTTILNIFSPSHYREFARVLTDDGTFIKVIPGPNYLHELRQAFFNGADKENYSNAPVMQHLSDVATIIKQQEINYQFELTDTAAFADLLQMSPLEWQATPEQVAALIDQPFSHISIDLQIVQCRLT